MGQRSLDQRRRLPLAAAASIALHGAVLVSASQTRWATAPDLREADSVIIWLSEWLPPEAPRHEDSPGDPADNQELPSSVTPQDAPVNDEDEAPPVVNDPEPSRSRLPADWEPIRPSIDWEEIQRRAVVRTREERAKVDAYVTFSYPQRIPGQTWDSGGSSATIAGIRIRPRRGPCTRSVSSFLTRLLLPVDICEWRTAGGDSYLSRDQQDTLAAIRADMEDNNLP